MEAWHAAAGKLKFNQKTLQAVALHDKRPEQGLNYNCDAIDP